jgi:hypothetical protein
MRAGEAGRVDTPARFDDEGHRVRLVAVRLHLLAVVDCRHVAAALPGIVSVPLLTRRCERGQKMPTSRIQEVPLLITLM